MVPTLSAEESKFTYQIHLSPSRCDEAAKMRTRIRELLGKLRKAEHEGTTFPYLAEVIESLEAMQNKIEAPSERRVRMAGALGRLVTEDFAFSESCLGGEILKLADDFAASR